jgi:hypothetical protein
MKKRPRTHLKMLALTNKEKLIRLAAFIDGEGNIRITKYNRKRITYSPEIRIASTSITLIKWLLDNFGGSYYGQKKYSHKHKDSYVWRAVKVYDLLRQVLPYLIIKPSQAELVLKFKGVSVAERPQLREELLVLNKRGL